MAPNSRVQSVLAECDAGQLSGYRDSLGCAFLGIPYGQPSTGARRFRPPLAVEPWSGVRDARRFGPQSMQSSEQIALMGAPQVMALLFDPPEWHRASEDCLNLNIWTPATDGARRPVMVWLHSGGFFCGTASTGKCRGDRLSHGGDVVVVTINHRLGLLGFLDLEQLDADFAGSANAGMLDLVLALQWIRRNVAAFGGDPDNVTIFGESGGGAKVSTLLTMPSARGLFHKAIIQSGIWPRFQTPDQAAELTAEILGGLGIAPGELARLADTPLVKLVAAQTAAMAWLQQRPFPEDGAQADRGFGPTVDGTIIPVQPWHPETKALATGVPLMIGTTQDEATFLLSGDPDFLTLDAVGLEARLAMMFKERATGLAAAYHNAFPDATPTELYNRIATDFFLRIPSTLLAERWSRLERPTFCYIFGYRTSVFDGTLGATHGVDIPFVFDTVDIDPLAGIDPARFDLAEQVRCAWVAFARYGTPSAPTLPQWPPFDPQRRATMWLGLPCRVIDDPERETRLLWNNAVGPAAT